MLLVFLCTVLAPGLLCYSTAGLPTQNISHRLPCACAFDYPSWKRFLWMGSLGKGVYKLRLGKPEGDTHNSAQGCLWSRLCRRPTGGWWRTLWTPRCWCSWTGLQAPRPGRWSRWAPVWMHSSASTGPHLWRTCSQSQRRIMTEDQRGLGYQGHI